MGNPLDEGRLRSTAVAIGGSASLPLAHPQLIDACFRQLVLTAQRIANPFERSFFLLVHVPSLQPFIDGNKRVARLGQVRTALGEPDVFRIEHRAALRQAVAEVVRAVLPRSAWRQALQAFAAKHVSEAATPRFIAAAELDLERLNEVTSARYTLQPSEFDAWALVRAAS